jgi:hypothetical protein
LLFEGTAIRITPPLTISEEEIREGCAIMLEVMDEIYIKYLFPAEFMNAAIKGFSLLSGLRDLVN